MIPINLTETPDGWAFRDGRGRTVRLDVTEPGRFTTSADARAAAVRHGLLVVGDRLTKPLPNGTKVERGRGLVFLGTIVGANADGTYEVQTDLGGAVDTLTRRQFRLVR